jgi:hypothetical protein
VQDVVRGMAKDGEALVVIVSFLGVGKRGGAGGHHGHVRRAADQHAYNAALGRHVERRGGNRASAGRFPVNDPNRRTRGSKVGHPTARRHDKLKSKSESEIFGQLCGSVMEAAAAAGG